MFFVPRSSRLPFVSKTYSRLCTSTENKLKYLSLLGKQRFRVLKHEMVRNREPPVFLHSLDHFHPHSYHARRSLSLVLSLSTSCIRMQTLSYSRHSVCFLRSRASSFQGKRPRPALASVGSRIPTSAIRPPAWPISVCRGALCHDKKRVQLASAGRISLRGGESC